MLLKLLESKYPLDEVVYFDIGVEFDSIRHNAEKMKNILKDKGIEFTILEMKEPFIWCMTEKPVEKRDGTTQCGYKWCGGCTRWGTAMKREAINANNRKYGNEMIVEYVGVAADERQRINRQRNGNRVKIYPLVEWEMKEADCLNYCYSPDGIGMKTDMNCMTCLTGFPASTVRIRILRNCGISIISCRMCGQS